MPVWFAHDDSSIPGLAARLNFGWSLRCRRILRSYSN